MTYAVGCRRSYAAKTSLAGTHSGQVQVNVGVGLGILLDLIDDHGDHDNGPALIARLQRALTARGVQLR